jgi:pimeloyl-ACP methyl ester carboxylesterase
MGAQAISQDGLVATAQVEADMQGTQVGAEINFFVWNDIVLGDFAKPTVWRVARYLVTVADYLATGTFFRIFRQAWRFSLYFLYPIGMLLFFTLLSIAVGHGVGQLGFGGSKWVALIVAISVWHGLLKWSGRRWFVLHLMDLWSFSRNHLRGNRTDIEVHMDRFAEAILARVRARSDDEIVLVGHSTGGALILEIAAKVLAKEPRLGSEGPRVTILTVGSTALKIGLHPAAKIFRQRVQSLVDASAIQWIECQAHTDMINFYKTNPVEAMKLPSKRVDTVPQVHVVRIRDMLQPEIYKRFKFNPFRVHYQFIMANTRRYAYDFFMMCCGEQPFIEGLGQSLRYRSASSK